jgi:hypothetical protein
MDPEITIDMIINKKQERCPFRLRNNKDANNMQNEGYL